MDNSGRAFDKISATRSSCIEFAYECINPIATAAISNLSISGINVVTESSANGMRACP